MNHSLVDAERFFDRRLKAFFFSSLALREMDVQLANQEWPWMVDRVAKLIGLVPEDSFLRGVFCHYDRDGVTAHWVHQSFKEIEGGNLIPYENDTGLEQITLKIRAYQRGETR